MLRTLFVSLSFGLAVASSEASLLDTKLESQWSAYRNAREYLLNKLENSDLPSDQKGVTRDEWEKLLELPKQDQLTLEERDELSKRQEARIERSRQNAILGSKIDLDAFRFDPSKVQEFCSQIPKGGMIHVHPLGTLKAETVDHLLNEVRNVPFDLNLLLHPGLESFETQWVKEHLGGGRSYRLLSEDEKIRLKEFFFLPKPFSYEFSRFSAIFSFIRFFFNTEQLVPVSLEDFVKRAVQQKVSYLEFTDILNLKNPVSVRNYEAVLEKLEKKYGVTIRVNHSFSRTQPDETLRSDLDLLMNQAPSKYIVGIDLVGDEGIGSALEKGQLLYGPLLLAHKQKKSKLRPTMHSGELGDPRNPRDSLILGAERLGHGVMLANDEVVLEYASLNRIPVEINLVSNQLLGSVKNLKNHPYLKFLRLGLPVSLSTDDEGIFETDINNECIQAISKTDVTYYELKLMSFNSISTSFLAKDEKQRLLIKLEKDFKQFELNSPIY